MPGETTPGITLSAVSGSPASTVTVSGAGFGAFEAVDIYFGIVNLALASANGTGNFSGIPVQVPVSAVAGTAYLTAVGRHSGFSAQAQLTVRNTVTVTNPGFQNSLVGLKINLQIRAGDSDNRQTLTFTATGLPPGLSINPTGLISGAPTVSGVFEVTVTAQDSTGGAGSAQFSWRTAAV